MDFYKIFKVLNSAQSSWQVALAIVFGMVSGFLPLFTVLNILILFIVFSLNIPFAIFVLSSVLFGSLALVLDPTFASIGYDILTTSEYKNIFTSMYNYAPTLWSSFNHTIVMGSLLVSVIAIIPAYFIFKILVDKYRILFEKWFKDSKYFSWLNPFNEKKMKKKPSIFRISGFLFISSVFGLIIAFVVLLIDPILRFTLEFSLNKAFKQDVYVSNVSSSFRNGTLSINDIIVKSNSSKPNDIKISKIKFDFNSKNLLHKKLDINTLTFSNILLKTSQEIKDKTTASGTVNNLLNDVKSSEILNSKETKSKLKLPTVEDILEKEDLQSLKQAKIIKKDIDDILKKYKNFSKNNLDKKELKALENKLKALQKDIKNIKNAKDVKNIIKESKTINNEIKNYNKKIKGLKADYKKDKALLEKHYKTLKTLPNEEFEYLKNKYKFNQDGAMNFIGTYVSASAKEYIQLALKYYEIAKPYIQGDEEETIEQKRLKGRYIHFQDKSSIPTFVIHNLNANVDINSYKSDVIIKNISSDPKKLNKLITMNAKSTNKKYEKAIFTLTHNALEKIQLTNMTLNVKGLKNSTYKASKELSLNDSLIDTNIEASINNFRTLKADMKSNIVKTKFDYKSNGSKTDDAIKNILANINSFNVKGNVLGDLKKPSIHISSNLDKKIAKGLKKEVSKELKKFEKKLKVKIKQKFKDELGSNISNDDFEKIEKLLASYDNKKSLQSNIANLSSSSLLADLKKKKEDELKAKAKKEIDKKKAEVQKEIDKKMALKAKKEKELKNKAKRELEKKFKSFF